MRALRLRLRYVAVATVVCATMTTSALAQPGPAKPVTGTFSVGFGVNQPGSKSLDMSAAFVDPPDRESFSQEYRLSRSGMFDVGGGVLLSSGVGFGVAVSRAKSSPVGTFTFALDHPQFHPVLTASTTEDDLNRDETGVHISASYRLPLKGRLGITLLGGPSHVDLTQDLAEDLDAEELFLGSNRFDLVLNKVMVDDESGSAWGYHAGADVSYRVAPAVELGMLARYSRATVELENALQSQAEDDDVTDKVKTGGLQLSWGLRLRF